MHMRFLPKPVALAARGSTSEEKHKRLLSGSLSSRQQQEEVHVVSSRSHLGREMTARLGGGQNRGGSQEIRR